LARAKEQCFLASKDRVMPQKLMQQKQVNYRSAEDGKGSCAMCANYMPPDKCSLVEGPISAGGMCDLFAPKAKAMTPAEMFVGDGGESGGES
jgi:hypothetical protein